MSIGNIKDYTPNYKLIIPKFDIATWHDYMESNFRSIDAMLFNIFAINNYKGEWKNSTTYYIGDVLFIGEDPQYEGRLVKVLVEHTTTSNDTFSAYYGRNPINYDLFQDAAGAADAAQLAKDWATKMDATVDNYEYSSKYYATQSKNYYDLISPYTNKISTVADNITAVNGVYNDLDKINTIAPYISSIDIVSYSVDNIDTVAQNVLVISNVNNHIASIQAVELNANNIAKVANIDSDVTTVATNVSKVSTVASISPYIMIVSNYTDEIQALAPYTSDIFTVSNNINAVNTTAANYQYIQAIANNLADVSTVATAITDVITVADIATDVAVVAYDRSNVALVAGGITNGYIQTVANDRLNIDMVGSHINNVNTTATNINNINTAATNIQSIINAPTYAQLAQDWANKTTGTVDGNEYSAKYYAQQAQTALNNKADKTNIINGAPLSNTSSYFYGTSDSAATDVEKVVSIPSITELNAGQVIIVQPTITSTVANSTLKLNNFTAYPMIYNGVAITTSTDSVVWSQLYPSAFIFDGDNWVFLCHGLDSNTTYVMNYSIDAGRYISGVGTYAITRYSLIMQKPDMTWEKITATNKIYTSATNKNVNTNGFILNQIKYYGTTTTLANGALAASNVVYQKAASVNLAYSLNCGTAPGWAVGDYIYLVGTIGADGLFYLDATQWWSNALPSTNDGKLYIRIGVALNAEDSTASFLDDRPIFYHNGIKICEYKVADNKQDTLVSGTNIKTINGNSLLGSGDITISGGGSEEDNLSITKNASNKIQTVGVIDQNNTATALKSWSGTKAQYDALVSGGTVDSNTLYNITDDTTNIYDTVMAIIGSIYPVGSIYLTVSNDNPATLLGLGTWTKISEGRVLQGSDSNHAAGTTINAGLPNITGEITPSSSSVDTVQGNMTGAFYELTSGQKGATATDYSQNSQYGFGFNASRSNSIYGNSNTVQPPAFVVNIWQRTA